MEKRNSKPLKIGLLGFGSMGRTHLWAVRNLPFFYGYLPFSAEVAGVATTTLEKSERMAHAFSIPFAAASEEDLINNPDIDIIDICTPNLSHFETLKKAIAAGKHIFCEKPLCTSLSEAREIASLPVGDGQIIGMSFNYRWISSVMRAKELIDEGKIGRILSFHAAYLHSSATNREKIASWKQDRTVCGGGVLFDLGSHVIDLMGFLCGRFAEVGGLSQIAYPERLGRDGKPWKTNADEDFILTGKTVGGATGVIRVGKIEVGTNDDLSFEIYGERGALKFSLMKPGFLEYYDATLPELPLGGNRGFTSVECLGRYPGMTFPSPKAPIGWLRGHLESIYSFLFAVYERRQFSPSLSDGYYVQSVMDAAYRSDAQSGVRISVTL